MDTDRYVKVNRVGIQEAARQMRYQYFEELLQEHGYASVATAHHQDDSIETFFINLLRGSGAEGLSGIKEDVERGLIRPLLAMNRAEIKDYANKNGVEWREDSSNSSDKYLRNRVRHELIPLIKDMRPGAEKAILRDMEIQAGLTELMESQVDDYRSACCREEGGRLLISMDGRAGETLILGKLLSEYGFNLSQVKDMLASEESGAQVLASGSVLTRHHGKLELSKHKEVMAGPWRIYENLSCNYLPLGLQLALLNTVPEQLDLGPNVALLDANQLKFPLSLRAWQAGDRIRPLGMQGEKKVSDLLNAAGVSVEEKKSVYVLLSAEDIIWVIGHRIDDRYKVRPDSKAVLQCTFDPCK